MRFIRGNKGTELPVNCLFVDTETKPVSECKEERIALHKLHFGNAISVRYEGGQFTRRKDYTFSTVGHFKDILIDAARPKNRLWIFSHNAGFDATISGLWQFVDKGYATISYLASNSPPTIIRFLMGTHSYVWLDTMNWFPMPLKEIGELIDLPKLTMPTADDSLAFWSAYCTRDTEIIMTAMERLFQFHEATDLGCFRFTAASQALQTYRHRFAPMQTIDRVTVADKDVMHTKSQSVLAIEPHTNPMAKAIERDSYTQGKSWCYFIGKVLEEKHFLELYGKAKLPEELRVRFGDTYALDVNGLYPYVMSKHSFPIKLKGTVINPSIQQLKELNQGYSAIANVLIDSPDVDYPVKTLQGSKIAVGQFWTTLCGPELDEALSDERVIKCSVACYYLMAPIFASYIEFFYNWRLAFAAEGNELFAKLCKTMCNSLYGKFAQRIAPWKEIRDEKPVRQWSLYSRWDSKNKRIVVCRGIGDLLQEKQVEDDCPHTFTAIASYVTSYGRMHMRNLERIAGRQGILYTNVDSLHVDESSYNLLVDAGEVRGNELGKLKVQAIAKSAEYRNLRDYTLDDKDTIAGVKSNATKLNDNEYEMDEFERLDTILARGPAAHVMVKRARVFLSHTFTAGSVDGIGDCYYPVLRENSTSPICDEKGRFDPLRFPAIAFDSIDDDDEVGKDEADA